MVVVYFETWMRAHLPPVNEPAMGNDDVAFKQLPLVQFVCRPNSHPFQERNIYLEQPVKVGRSVARAKATPTNAIFDCKVLSRHHALLWYEDGKFFLQDTKSSNGTFVNNIRLVPDAETHELSSGDIVQFGVDVIENNRKVTHGCIIATLKLYLPDGKEAKASPSILENSSHVPLEELYKLHQIIQEASQREQVLETKLAALQVAVHAARASAEDSWQAYVGEERLLSHLSALETKLQQAQRNWSENKYLEENAKLQDEINVYQTAAKEALEKLHTERLEALARATEQELGRNAAEEEMLMTRDQLIELQRQLEEVAKKLDDEQTRANEDRTRSSNNQRELQSLLDLEKARNEVLAMAVKHTAQNNDDNKSDPTSFITENLFDDDEIKARKLITGEIDGCDTNGLNAQQNHINLNVAPVTEPLSIYEYIKDQEKYKRDEETTEVDEDSSPRTRDEKHVTFATVRPEENENENETENEQDSDGEIGTDTKTLKYKYQTVQNELKRQIESLERNVADHVTRIEQLESDLDVERHSIRIQKSENEYLRDDVERLQRELDAQCDQNETLRLRLVENDQRCTYEQLVKVEEELIALKERYAAISDEKVKLQQDLGAAVKSYNRVCNSANDKLYFTLRR